MYANTQRMKEGGTYLLDFSFRTNLRGMMGTSSGSTGRFVVVVPIAPATTDSADFVIGFNKALKMSLFPSKTSMFRPVPVTDVTYKTDGRPTEGQRTEIESIGSFLRNCS